MTQTLNWTPARVPDLSVLQGRYVRLERLDPDRHGDGLWVALQGPGADAALWDYLPYGPFSDRETFDRWLTGNAASQDPSFYSVVDLNTGEVQGLLSYMSIVPDQGRFEIGHIAFGASMQRTTRATEAVYLLADLGFTLGNRRLEWKCNDANARSKRAAERFGFMFEGVFRQHMVVKDRNRDTAWYSITDAEWPGVKAGFDRWLSPTNQPPSGQLETLESCRLVGAGLPRDS